MIIKQFYFLIKPFLDIIEMKKNLINYLNNTSYVLKGRIYKKEGNKNVKDVLIMVNAWEAMFKYILIKK